MKCKNFLIPIINTLMFIGLPLYSIFLLFIHSINYKSKRHYKNHFEIIEDVQAYACFCGIMTILILIILIIVI